MAHERDDEREAGGFPEPPGRDPGDRSDDPDPHDALNNPVGEPDPTEYPDPYEQREDPLDPPDPDGEPFGEEPHARRPVAPAPASHTPRRTPSRRTGRARSGTSWTIEMRLSRGLAYAAALGGSPCSSHESSAVRSSNPRSRS